MNKSKKYQISRQMRQKIQIKKQRIILNIDNYWRNRNYTTLVLALFAIVFGHVWGLLKTSIIDFVSILIAVLLIGFVLIIWYLNRTLERDLVEELRKNKGREELLNKSNDTLSKKISRLKRFWIRFVHYFFKIWNSIRTKKSKTGKPFWLKRIIIYFIYYAPTILSLLILLCYLMSWSIWGKPIDSYASKTSPIIRFFQHYLIIPQAALLWGGVFAVDIGFLLYRWTYRVFPNVFLSITTFILYIIIMSFPRGDSHALGLGILDEERLSFFLADTFKTWLGWGLISTILTTLLSKASEDIWHGFSRNGTGDYAKIDYRFKQQRLKLLSYLGGTDDQIKGLTKMGWIMIAFFSSFVVEGFLAFFLKKGDMRHIMIIAYLLGAACAIMGFMLHRFISDENLMRSENSYLIDRKIRAIECLKNKESPCEKLDWEWTCYCQVFVNLYCSRSPIFYEDNLLHEGGHIISYFIGVLDEKVCLARVLADFVSCHKEQFSLYCGSEAGPEKDFMELQFARIVAEYIDFFGRLSPGEPIDFADNKMSLRVMSKCFDMYFRNEDDDGSAYTMLLEVANVSKTDAINLVKLDCFRMLIYSRSDSACKLCKWCQKTSHENCNDESRPLIAEMRRVVFPRMVRFAMTDRWGEKNLIPKTYHKEKLDIDKAFEIMEKNYYENWIEEASRYGIDDKDYWKNGIFYEIN